MATILQLRGPDGSFLRRCDARCYNATKPKCNCICRGANHGVGLDQALDNINGRPNRIPHAFLEQHPDVPYVETQYHDRIHNPYSLDLLPPP